jgi:DNA-binding NarL/FixJ family response regulator
MTRILIVDDHPVVLQGIKGAMSEYEDIEVVGEAPDGREAIKKVEALEPDIIVMDIAMPRFNGVDATRQIKKKYPKTKVIIFTLHSYQEFIHPLIKAGISGFVLKQNPISDLYLAIQVVRRGGAYFSEDVQQYLANYFELMGNGEMDEDPFDLLSDREKEIFQLLAEGHSTKEAAEILSISTKTVETPKYRIMEKLHINSMAEWIREGIRRGVVQL